MTSSIRPTRVLVADDHQIVADGIQAQLASHPDFTLLPRASSFEQVRALLATLTADVLILDIHNMGGGLLQLLASLRRDYPDMAIVIFSSIINLAPEALAAGALGYVAKEDLSSHLVQAIRAVRAGQRFVSPVVQMYLDAASLPARSRLTPQELRVVKLLAQNLRTAEIAEFLSLDPRTVYNYLASARLKTQTRTQIELIDWYRRTYTEDEPPAG